MKWIYQTFNYFSAGILCALAFLTILLGSIFGFMWNFKWNFNKETVREYCNINEWTFKQNNGFMGNYAAISFQVLLIAIPIMIYLLVNLFNRI